MKSIQLNTLELITKELANLPKEYASKNFASEAEAIAVIREEYLELEKEVFWGKKKIEKELFEESFKDSFSYNKDLPQKIWKDKMRAEAVQLAAMTLRFIQECCGLTIHDLKVGGKYEISYHRHGIIDTQVFEVTKITNYTLFAMPFELNHYEVTFIKEIV